MMNCFFPPDKLQNCKKLKKNNSGAEISFSKSSIRKSVKQGGSLWTSLLKLTPFLTKGVFKIARIWQLALFQLWEVWELIKSLEVECREEQFSPMQL